MKQSSIPFLVIGLIFDFSAKLDLILAFLGHPVTVTIPLVSLTLSWLHLILIEWLGVPIAIYFVWLNEE